MAGDHWLKCVPCGQPARMPAHARTTVGAGICSALLALIWLLAFHTGFGEHVDLSFNGFVGLQRPA